MIDFLWALGTNFVLPKGQFPVVVVVVVLVGSESSAVPVYDKWPWVLFRCCCCFRFTSRRLASVYKMGESWGPRTCTSAIIITRLFVGRGTDLIINTTFPKNSSPKLGGTKKENVTTIDLQQMFGPSHGRWTRAEPWWCLFVSSVLGWINLNGVVKSN